MSGVKFPSIQKAQVEAAVIFAVQNIPGIDAATLRRFLEFVNAREERGLISNHELLEKMRLVHKYIPSTCTYSLMVLADLLDLTPPEPAFAFV